ncbi:MAG: sensor histidine kinase [Blastocatellia bacterium]
MNSSDSNNEQAMLAEVGRATARLIHDFKNQLGGLKLYTAYLKKRFAAHLDKADLAEALEITDKINQSVNEMTEHANLIGKLTRPVELKLADADFTSLVEQAINQIRPTIAERGLTLESDLAETSPIRLPIRLDAQQMLLALGALLSRAIEATVENGRLRISLRSSEGKLQLSIFDEGERLTEEQQQSFFDFLTNERLNKTSLNLALARRIIEAHDGQIVALAAEASDLAGVEVRVRFEI